MATIYDFERTPEEFDIDQPLGPINLHRERVDAEHAKEDRRLLKVGLVALTSVAIALFASGCGEDKPERIPVDGCITDELRKGDLGEPGELGIDNVRYRIFPHGGAVPLKEIDTYVNGQPWDGGFVQPGDEITFCTTDEQFNRLAPREK